LRWDGEGEGRNEGVRFGVILSWEEAEPMLCYEFEWGYGGYCHPIYAWTKTRVLVTECYDGCKDIKSVPRNPQAVVPEMIGGG